MTPEHDSQRDDNDATKPTRERQPSLIVTGLIFAASIISSVFS